MSKVETYQVTQDDVITWWEEFLNADLPAKIRTGIVSGDSMLLFAQFERSVPADHSTIRGIADFTTVDAKDVTKVIFPIINTAATNAAFADAENAFITGPYSTVRRRNDQNIISIPFNRVTAQSTKGNRLSEPYYDGLWSCISKSSLTDGDTIEFGAAGSRNFKTASVWECKFK